MIRYCASVSCESVKISKQVEHEVLDIVVPPGLTAKHYHLKCSVCGYESFDRVPSRVRPQRYPYYSASTDQVFQDKDHEKKYVKEKKLDAL